MNIGEWWWTTGRWTAGLEKGDRWGGKRKHWVKEWQGERRLAAGGRGGVATFLRKQGLADRKPR